MHINMTILNQMFTMILAIEGGREGPEPLSPQSFSVCMWIYLWVHAYPIYQECHFILQCSSICKSIFAMFLWLNQSASREERLAATGVVKEWGEKRSDCSFENNDVGEEEVSWR